MGTISNIEPQKHDPERVNVYVDGAFCVGVSLLVAEQHGLRIGHELSEAEIDSLRDDDDAEKAFGAALHFLSFRPRSRREVADYFRRRKLEPAVGDAVLARLERVGVLDDREFARFWVENRQRFRPRGPRALRHELRGKGLEGELVEEVLEAEEGDQDDAAYRAGQKRAQGLRSLDEREFMRRMAGFLQRRGFDYDVSARVARRLWEEVSA